MQLKKIKENLVRRMATHYVAYMGQKNIDPEWLEGYFKAKKDVESFLSQLEIYEPYSSET